MNCTKTVLRVLVILIAFDLLFITDAAAETGTVSVSTQQIFSYTGPGTGGSGVEGPDFTKIVFDTADYNTIVNFTVSPAAGDTTYPNQSNVTTFTCVTPNVCSGVASYSQALNKFSWVFSQGAVITSTPITLTYSDNIYQGFSFVASVISVAYTNNPNKPLCISSATGKCWQLTNTGHFVSYAVDVSSTASVRYNITYPISGWYSFFVDKSGNTVQSNIAFHSQSNNSLTYDAETTFTTTNFSGSSQYTDGLYMNMSLSGGQSKDILINASGATVPSANSTNPGLGGSPSGQIYFDYLTAALGSSYGINVSISDANFSTLDTYYIDVIDPGNQQVFGFPVSFKTQQYSTSRMWSFNLLGTYNATLSYCTFLLFCADIDTASLLVNPVNYAYNISTDQTSYFTGQTINVTAVNPSPNTVYVNVFLDVGGQNKIVDAPVTGGTTRYFNIPVTSDMIFGKWDAVINTAVNGAGRVAQTNFTIGVPEAGQAVGIRWDINYFLGRTNNLYYVTNLNSSTVIVNKPIPGTNTSLTYDTFIVGGNNSTFKPYLMDVTGYWTAYITDSGNASNISYANMTVLSSPTCNLNGPDYVCWSNASYNLGDAFRIDYKATNLPVDQAALLRLVIYDPDNTIIANKTIINNLPVTSKDVPTTGSMTGKFKSTAKPGKWHASLIISCLTTGTCTDETQLADGFTFVVAPAPTVSPTPPIPSGSEASGSMQSNILYFMSTKAFWGVLLFAFLLIMSRNLENVGYIAFVLANIFAVVGLWDPFKWYILAVSWIGAGIFFYVGRQAT